MTFRYKVLAPCYINNTYHVPGDPRHGEVVTQEKIDPLPAHLVEIKAETKAAAESRTAAAEKLGKKVKAQKEEIKGATFLSDPNAEITQGGVETL